MNREKTVYLIRHAQSADNVSAVFQSPKSLLSSLGEKQAKIIAGRISKLDFELLVSSPFQRARQTAEEIKINTGKEIEFSDLFIERKKPTSINGKPYEDKTARIIWRDWEKSLYTSGVRVEDGENFDDLIVRADRALEFLSNRKENPIVVVTHGYFLRTIIARVLIGRFLSGEIFRNFQRSAEMENTGLTVLKYRDRFEEKPAWRLWIYNDHAHLAD